VMLPGVERDAMTLQGRVNVTTTLRGTIKDPHGEALHVLTQKLKVSSQGEVSGKKPLSYEVSGEGEGLVLCDVKSGVARRYNLEFSTRLRVTGEGEVPVEVTSTYLFARSPATPEVGEQ
jgi:phosphoribosylformylglycinamidine (FGAM) synthase PurS component